jgi:hypothetical protein
MAAIPIAGFLPDADPTTPGIWTACDGFVPTVRGMRSASTPVSVGYAALGAACKGAAVAHLVAGGTRVIAGTAEKLWDIQSGVWTDITRATGGDYAAGTANWRFAQVGNVTIAVNKADLPQSSNSSGAFANIADMPKASYIATSSSTSGEFLFLGSTNDNGLSITGGPNSDDENRVWWSGIGNYTEWEPALASQSGTLQLLDTPGAITGLRALGDYVVAYKERATHVMTYGGSTVLWGARTASNEIGAISQESVVATDKAHFFIGVDSIYRFAGDVPQDIGAGIKEYFFSDYDSSATTKKKVHGLYDRYKDLIYWFYPSRSGGGAVDSWIALHIGSGRWGAGTTTVECCLEGIGASVTYDSFGSTLTYDTLPDVVYDSDYWNVGRSFPAVFDGSHIMSALDGPSGNNSFTTGYMGDDAIYSRVRRMTPRWQLLPTSATCAHSHTSILGQAPTAKTSVNMYEGRFDLHQSARWHQFTVGTVGNCELSALTVDGIAHGRE